LDKEFEYQSFFLFFLKKYIFGMWANWTTKQVSDGDVFIMEECETPITKEQYQDLSSRTLKMLLNLEKETQEDGWIPIHVPEEGVELWEKPDRKTGISCVKSSGIINCPPKKFFYYAFNQDLVALQRWEPDLKEYKILERITDDIKVVYRNYSAPYGVTPREFIVLNAKSVLPDGTFLSYGRSINHKEGRYDSRYVRGFVPVSGFIVRPIKGEPNKCHCIRMAMLDPKGMIPPWVISIGKRRAATSFNSLRKTAEQDLSQQQDDEEEEENFEDADNDFIENKDVIYNGTKHLEVSASLPDSISHTPPSTQTQPNEQSQQFLLNNISPTTENNSLTQQYLHQLTQLQSQQSQIQLQNTMQSIQVLLLNIQSETKLNTEHIKNTQNTIASQNSIQEQQLQFQKKLIASRK